MLKKQVESIQKEAYEKLSQDDISKLTPDIVSRRIDKFIIVNLCEDWLTFNKFMEDVIDGMECLPKCDSTMHEDNCPVAFPEAAWRKLRQENEELKLKISGD